jgi:Gnt-I system low-affinity gluconate transporter
MNTTLLIAVILGIVALMFMILRLKIPAFIALLITSIFTALAGGMAPDTVMLAVKEGMASTLGFIAIVVGLGSIFGGILEHTGGAQVIANYFMRLAGDRWAPYALMFTGFLVSIPIFFDVGIIILFPVLLAVQRRTGLSILHFAVPLFAGLAVSHAFIPPTPGPMAVTEILGAPMGYIILIGTIVGLPTAYISGILFGKFIGDRIHAVPEASHTIPTPERLPNISVALPLLLLPIILIVLHSLVDTVLITLGSVHYDGILKMSTHPFAALILSCLSAWYILGRGMGYTTEQLQKFASQSLTPAGIILLVTGAGGVFKEILIKTGAGTMIAESMQSLGIGIMLFAWLAATFIRVLQGSATVAMITAAGLVAPVLKNYTLTDAQLACVVIAISSGATMASHINDSGFWLIKEYLGLTEKQAIRTWTVATTILGTVGFILACTVYYIVQ